MFNRVVVLFHFLLWLVNVNFVTKDPDNPDDVEQQGVEEGNLAIYGEEEISFENPEG